MKRLPWTLAVAALLALAAGFIPLHGLEVRESGGTGKVVFIKRVAPGDTFSLCFIHSVEKSEVTDYFRIDDDHRIILYQTEFGSLNTGLPAVVSKGEIFERTDGVFGSRISTGSCRRSISGSTRTTEVLSPWTAGLFPSRPWRETGFFGSRPGGFSPGSFCPVPCDRRLNGNEDR